jgi:hypothetical protein
MVLLVFIGVVFCALLVQWLLMGPPPPAPPWGTRVDSHLRAHNSHSTRGRG